MKKTTWYFCLLLAASLGPAACKKDKSTNDPDPVNTSLTGQWEETPKQVYSRRIAFRVDGKFSMTILEDGTYATQLNGNWTVTGDSLNVRLTEQLEKQSGSEMVRTEVNSVLFEKATYEIKDDILTINYVTYPADAPVLTEMRLKRVLPPS